MTGKLKSSNWFLDAASKTNGHLGVRGCLRVGEDDLTGSIVACRGHAHKGSHAVQPCRGRSAERHGGAGTQLTAHCKPYNALALSRKHLGLLGLGQR